MKTVLDPVDPTVEVKVTNSTGKEATLQGWLNDVPAQAIVPARSAIVELVFPEMTEGQATLTLSLTANGVQDVEVHDVVVMARGYGYPTQSPTPSPKPSWSKWPQPSKSPSTSHSELPQTGDSVSSYVFLGGGMLVFGMFVLGLAWALGRRTASESATEG